MCSYVFSMEVPGSEKRHERHQWETCPIYTHTDIDIAKERERCKVTETSSSPTSIKHVSPGK